MLLRQLALLVICFILPDSLAVDAPGKISGKVLGDNDAPIAGLPIDYFGRTSGRVITGADGSFEFVAYSGFYNVFADSGEVLARNLFNPGSKYLAIESGQTISNVLFRLRATSSLVTGFLKDSNGAAVTNISITFSSGISDFAAGFTDATGAFWVRLFPGTWTAAPDTTLLNQRGFLNSPAQTWTLTAGEHTINFTAILPTKIVSGILQDDLGAAVKGLEMRAASASSQNAFTFISSETDGSFSIKLAPGIWSVGAAYSIPLHERGYHPLSFAIEVGASPLTTNIITPRLASRMLGGVRDTDGTFLTNVNFTLETTLYGAPVWTLVTSGAGLFDVRVPNGTWKVQPSAYELNRYGLEAPPAKFITLFDQTNFTLIFTAAPPASVIRGTIRDETGAPVSNLVVRASAFPGGIFSAQSDEQGRYAVSVGAGSWSINIEPDSIRERAYVSPEVFAGAEIGAEPQVVTRDLSVRRAPYTITVHVVNASGELVTAADGFSYFGATTYAHLYAATNSIGSLAYLSNGIARLAVSPGLWGVTVNFPEGYRPVPGREVRIFTNSVDMMFVAKKWENDSTLTGKVIDDNGAAMTNLLLTLYGPTQPRANSTDENGNFTFLVPDGDWYLSAQTNGFIFPSASIRTRSGETTNRIFRALQTNAELRIRLRPDPGVSVEHFFAGGSMLIGQDDYRLSAGPENNVITLNLIAGTWRFYFHDSFGTTRYIPERELTVAPGTQEITVDLRSAAPTATIRGRVVDHAGQPVAAAYVNAATIGNSTNSASSNEQFEFGVFGGPWEVQAGHSTSSIYVTKIVHVADGGSHDLGTFTIPDSPRSARIRLTDPNGALLNFDSPFSVSATRIVVAEQHWSGDSGWGNDRVVRLGPGEWEIQISTPGLRDILYRPPAPFKLIVQETDLDLLIPALPLVGTLSGPRFSTLPSLGRIPRLRLSHDTFAILKIEQSINLTDWQFHSTALLDGVWDLHLLDSSSNQMRFFRATLLQ